MLSIRTSLAAVVIAGATLATAAGASATPASGGAKGDEAHTEVFHARLEGLNDSGATGTATLRLRGNVLDVRIRARGLAPNLVHAQHIHGVGNSECPPPSAAGADGVLTTADGLPFYGPIVTSLTTSGDTSPSAGLTIELMPVADSRGRIRYHRSIDVPADVATDLAAFQIVQHGVDINGNGEYDFSASLRQWPQPQPQPLTQGGAAPSAPTAMEQRLARRPGLSEPGPQGASGDDLQFAEGVARGRGRRGGAARRPGAARGRACARPHGRHRRAVLQQAPA